MEPRDSAVVRPLFFTAWLIEAASVVFEIVPISRIAPLLATCPVTTFPIEQSTLLLGIRFKNVIVTQDILGAADLNE